MELAITPTLGQFPPRTGKLNVEKIPSQIHADSPGLGRPLNKVALLLIKLHARLLVTDKNLPDLNITIHDLPYRNCNLDTGGTLF